MIHWGTKRKWFLSISVIGILLLSGMVVVGSPVFGHPIPGSQASSNPHSQAVSFANSTNASSVTQSDPSWSMAGGNAANTRHIDTTGPTDPITSRWQISTKAERLTEPVIVDGIIYVGTDDKDDDSDEKVMAIDAWTGEIHWQFTDFGSTGPNTVAVFRDTVYVTTRGGEAYALDKETGETFWTTRFSSISKEPIVANGILYIPTVDELFARSALTGDFKWQFSAEGRDVSGKPAIAKGTVYLAYGKHNKRVATALDADSGTISWQVDMPAGGGHWKRPIIADDTLYFSTSSGEIYAMDPKAGKVLWQRKIRGTGIHGSPAVVGDTAYVGTHDRPLFALNTKTGETRWTYREANSVPTVTNETVYLSDGRSVYTLDAETGKEITTFTVDAPWRADSAAVVLNGSLYTSFSKATKPDDEEEGGPQDTRLYALGTPEINYEQLELSTGSVDINETLTATLTIKNKGTGPGSFNATVFVDGKLVDFRNDTLDPRRQTKVTFDLQFPTKGTYTIEIAGKKRVIAVGDVATPTPIQTHEKGVDTKETPSGNIPTATSDGGVTTESITSSSSPGFGVVVWLLGVMLVVGWFGRHQRN